MFDFSLLAEILIDLEGAIDSYEVSQDKGLTKPGMYVERMNKVESKSADLRVEH